MIGGHSVTAIVRNTSKLTNDTVKVLEKIYDLTSENLKQFDIVVNAFGLPLGEVYVKSGRSLIEALKETGTRTIIVGGAGILCVDEAQTIELIDTPEFPDIINLMLKERIETFKI